MAISRQKGTEVGTIPYSFRMTSRFSFRVDITIKSLQVSFGRQLESFLAVWKYYNIRINLESLVLSLYFRLFQQQVLTIYVPNMSSYSYALAVSCALLLKAYEQYSIL